MIEPLRNQQASYAQIKEGVGKYLERQLVKMAEASLLLSSVCERVRHSVKRQCFSRSMSSKL